MAVCLQVNQSGGRAQRGVGQNLHRKVGVQSTMPLARMMNRWFNQYSQKGAFAPPKLLAYSQKSQAGAIFPQLALSMLMFAAGSSRSCRRTPRVAHRARIQPGRIDQPGRIGAGAGVSLLFSM